MRRRTLPLLLCWRLLRRRGGRRHSERENLLRNFVSSFVLWMGLSPLLFGWCAGGARYVDMLGFEVVQRCSLRWLQPSDQKFRRWSKRFHRGAGAEFPPGRPATLDSTSSETLPIIPVLKMHPHLHNKNALGMSELAPKHRSSCANIVVRSVRGRYRRSGGVPLQRLHAQGLRGLQRSEGQGRSVPPPGTIQDASRQQSFREGEARQDQGAAEGAGPVNNLPSEIDRDNPIPRWDA